MSEGLKALRTIREQIPKEKSVTLVGGAFDLLHPGHLHLLDYAKKLGDVLVVSVLSDQYVKSYKGEERPIIPEAHRLSMVQGLKSVDHAFISDVSSYGPENLSILQPNNIVFGDKGEGERQKKKAESRERISKEFPTINFYDLDRFDDDSISTGKIIEKIKKL